MIVFVDSSAFIALAIKSDRYNMPAKGLLNEIVSQARLITSTFVLDETITYLNSRQGSEAAYKFGDRMLQSSLYEIVDIDKVIFHEALKLLRQFRDKTLSFTDLTSFAVMRLRKIRRAFTFDHDFIEVGFETIP